ncbi:MAG TPA: alpha/beta fold hydrolase [Solirubrobacteraceae bacterium]|jgi:flavin-dependent dehydrogenase/pimeloyl-ACP methyl ester carboxylesterase|nr:alpha/beta fold hydrolase [Solirubrobacteraceae bacterium]
MSETCDYDVAVVGASIAGCTVATLLGRAGARVALLERRPDPAAYKTICTHFIQACATPTIQRLGLAEPIEAAGGLRNGVEVWSKHGWIRPRLDDGYDHPRYGYDIRREKLDPMLRELAARTPGVDLLPGETVTSLLRSDGRPAGVRIADRTRHERELTARVVVGADGRDSQVARMAGVPARVRPHARFGYFAYYRDLPLATGDHTLFWFLDPDVAYAFPQDDGITLMAVFPTKDKLSWFRRDLESNFEQFFRGLPNAPDLSTGTRISKVLGKLEMPNAMRPAARPGVAFAGDAAMAADPLWGVGCGWAFQSGEWLAEELGGVLGAADTSNGEIDRALERYRRRHRRELLGHYLLTSDYSSGRRFSPIERLLFAAAAKDERSAASFNALGARCITPNGGEFARLGVRTLRVNALHPRRVAVDPPTGAHAAGGPAPAGVRQSRLLVDGLGVPLSSAGPPDDDEAVVFVHGNPGSRRDWDDLLARVAPFARAVAWDMPGFGHADKPRDFDYTVAGYARLLGRALDELGVRRAHLVLHDFGGPWGLEWAAAHGDRLASVVLVNTGALIDYRWHYLARIWRTRLAGEAFQAATTRFGLRTALRHGNPRGLPRAFVDRMYDDMDAGTSRAILRLYRSTDDPGAGGRRHAEAMRALDPPALVVWGAHDPYIKLPMAARQREAFPSARIEVLPDSGHWPFADDPEGVGRLVEPFLREAVGADRASDRA